MVPHMVQVHMVQVHMVQVRVVWGHMIPISGVVKSSFPHPHLGWSPWWWTFKEYFVLLLVAAAGVRVVARHPETRALALPLGCMVAGAMFHWLNTVLVATRLGMPVSTTQTFTP